MSDKLVDKAKGRVQEAAGALKGDEGMKARGRGEQAKGAVKKAAEKSRRRRRCGQGRGPPLNRPVGASRTPRGRARRLHEAVRAGAAPPAAPRRPPSRGCGLDLSLISDHQARVLGRR